MFTAGRETGRTVPWRATAKNKNSKENGGRHTLRRVDRGKQAGSRQALTAGRDYTGQQRCVPLSLSERNADNDRIDLLFGFERVDRNRSLRSEQAGWLINMRTVTMEDHESGAQLAGVHRDDAPVIVAVQVIMAGCNCTFACTQYNAKRNVIVKTC